MDKGLIFPNNHFLSSLAIRFYVYVSLFSSLPGFCVYMYNTQQRAMRIEKGKVQKIENHSMANFPCTFYDSYFINNTLSFYFCCMLAISNLLLMDFFLWILSIEYLTVVMFVAEIAHCLPQNREQIFIEYFQSSIEFNWKVKYEQGLPFWWRLHGKSIKGKKLNKGERWREKKRQHEKHEH